MTDVCLRKGGTASNITRHILPGFLQKLHETIPDVWEQAGRLFFLRTPREGAQTSVWAATRPLTGPELAPGQIWRDPAKILEVPQAAGEEGAKKAKELWERTEEIVSAAAARRR